MRPFGAKSVHWFRSYKHFAEEVKFSRYDHISQLTTKKFVFNLLWGVRGGPNDMDPPWYQQGRLFWACQQKKKFSKFSYPVYPESSQSMPQCPCISKAGPSEGLTPQLHCPGRTSPCPRRSQDQRAASHPELCSPLGPRMYRPESPTNIINEISQLAFQCAQHAFKPSYVRTCFIRPYWLSRIESFRD